MDTMLCSELEGMFVDHHTLSLSTPSPGVGNLEADTTNAERFWSRLVSQYIKDPKSPKQRADRRGALRESEKDHETGTAGARCRRRTRLVNAVGAPFGHTRRAYTNHQLHDFLQ